MSSAPVFLCLHIPKTAGTSLSSLIHSQYEDATGCCEEEGQFCSGVYYFPGELGFIGGSTTRLPDRVVRTLHRNDLRAVMGHFHYGLHTLINRPTIYGTMFRDPVERVVSLYYHLQRWPNPKNLGWSWFARAGLKPLEAGTSLEEFVRTYPLLELDNDQTRRVAGEYPAYGASSRALLQQAKTNIERSFSFVGVTERFQDSLQVAAILMGWSLEFTDRRKNVNEQRPPTASIPLEARAAILERNALDLELYAFANQWLDDRLGATGVGMSSTAAQAAVTGS
jgi:hypothetical protein